MKKKLKLKKPKVRKPNIRLPKRGKTVEEKVSDAISNVPRITNETVTEHREDVLSSARKYIYPLQHSKHRVVRTSIAIFVLVIVLFFGFCALDLYEFQGTSGFIYDVTSIVPFPVGKTGGHFISYNSYLFELRRDMHYYTTQQQANFSSKDGQDQLSRLKTQAMDAAVNNELVNILAKQNHVSVTNQEVNAQLNTVKTENRLGSSEQVFKEVLSQYWGWTVSDFKTELKDQVLQQAVVSKLDTNTNNRAKAALEQLSKGADFGTLASQISDDLTTRAGGGQYPNAVTLDDQQVSPLITQELFKLQLNQVSPIINTGYTLEILKVIDRNGSTLHAAHIQFNFANITNYTKPLVKRHPTSLYISIK